MRASPYAVGLWGVEAVGLTPTSLCAFRTRVAAASGINQARRCPTTAIYVAFGLDPLEDLMRRVLVSFYSWAADVPIRRLAPAWAVIYDGLMHNGLFTWGKVDACLGPSGFQRCTLEEPFQKHRIITLHIFLQPILH